MCGIFGYYSFNNEIVDKIKFNASLLTIIHRGPDFQQSKFYNNDTIALGHVRLSIIDPSPSANQPMKVNDYQIVFNGEIYNYIELREELKEKGYLFQTNSDTEVLVNAYDYWGESCVNKFNGMWAFAILNEKDNTLFCSRDRFGVKPFNYCLDEDRFIFGSEIKPIIAYDNTLKKPNYNSIGLFCREGIGGEIPETWFENILRLLPAHNLTIKDGKVKIYKYYNYPSITSNISFDNAKKMFHDLFIDSVKIRMRSDVPVGTTLSGGLDSTSIVAALRTFSDEKHNTFTAHFPGFIDDECTTADKTNKFFKLNGNPIEINYDNELMEILKKLIYHLESGHFSPSILPLWKVYAEAKTKVTVVLEGQGADELLGGYITAFAGLFLTDKLKKLQFGKFYVNLKKLLTNYSLIEILILYLRFKMPSFAKTISRRYILKSEGVLTGMLSHFKYNHKPNNKSDSNFLRVLQNSHQTTLVNLLHYGDAISMAFSLESRLPYMDYRLVDFIFTLPDDFLIANGKGKFIQREALKDILPDYINNNEKKLGFPSPIADYFNEHKNVLRDIFFDQRTLRRGIFDKNKLEKLINSDLTTYRNSSRFLFRLLCVEIWFRVFIDDKTL